MPLLIVTRSGGSLATNHQPKQESLPDSVCAIRSGGLVAKVHPAGSPSRLPPSPSQCAPPGRVFEWCKPPDHVVFSAPLHAHHLVGWSSPTHPPGPFLLHDQRLSSAQSPISFLFCPCARLCLHHRTSIYPLIFDTALHPTTNTRARIMLPMPRDDNPRVVTGEGHPLGFMIGGKIPLFKQLYTIGLIYHSLPPSTVFRTINTMVSNHRSSSKSKLSCDSTRGLCHPICKPITFDTPITHLRFHHYSELTEFFSRCSISHNLTIFLKHFLSLRSQGNQLSDSTTS